MQITKWASVFLAASLALSACTPTGPAERVKDPEEKAKEEAGSIFGQTLTFGGDGGGERTGGGIAVNSFLWRASLDTLSFVPLSQVDPFGGVILTEWYSPPESPNERFKMNVYILTRTLRSDGIRISVFKQQRRGNDQWVDVQVDKDTATQLENSILTKARQLRINLDADAE